MKKIYIVAAAVVLVILIIVSLILSIQPKSSLSNPASVPFPTSIPLGGVNRVSPQITSTLPPEINNSSVNQPLDISTISPVQTADFSFQYSGQLNKLVVERKSDQADQKFNEWAMQNNYPQLINNPDNVVIVNPGQTPITNPMVDLINIFMNLGQNTQKINGTSSSNSQLNSPTTNSSSTSSSTGYVYYPQCGDSGNLSLPSGCNLCQAGCGPTTVSMIASSYFGKNFDPKTIVGLYQSHNYLLGCSGSRYSDAHELLQQLGLKTTDYIVFNSEKAATVVPVLRPYLNAGWTFFTLARYCDSGCGHYFWITDIDGQGNIMAYDPYYGRYEIPFNENSKNPYPLYLLAFGVRK